MRRAGWYLVTGAVAGFAGVLGFHIGGTAAPAVLGQPKGETGFPSASAPVPPRRPGRAVPRARPGALPEPWNSTDTGSCRSR